LKFTLFHAAAEIFLKILFLSQNLSEKRKPPARPQKKIIGKCLTTDISVDRQLVMVAIGTMNNLRGYVVGVVAAVVVGADVEGGDGRRGCRRFSRRVHSHCSRRVVCRL
jgi:hypothetical protein